MVGCRSAWLSGYISIELIVLLVFQDYRNLPNCLEYIDRARRSFVMFSKHDSRNREPELGDFKNGVGQQGGRLAE